MAEDGTGFERPAGRSLPHQIRVHGVSYDERFLSISINETMAPNVHESHELNKHPPPDPILSK